MPLNNANAEWIGNQSMLMHKVGMCMKGPPNISMRLGDNKHTLLEVGLETIWISYSNHVIWFMGDIWLSQDCNTFPTSTSLSLAMFVQIQKYVAYVHVHPHHVYDLYIAMCACTHVYGDV